MNPGTEGPSTHQRIAERAYLAAEKEGFDPGRDLDRWLEAEAVTLAEVSPTAKPARRAAPKSAASGEKKATTKAAPKTKAVADPAKPKTAKPKTATPRAPKKAAD